MLRASRVLIRPRVRSLILRAYKESLAVGLGGEDRAGGGRERAASSLLRRGTVSSHPVTRTRCLLLLFFLEVRGEPFIDRNGTEMFAGEDGLLFIDRVHGKALDASATAFDGAARLHMRGMR